MEKGVLNVTPLQNRTGFAIMEAIAAVSIGRRVPGCCRNRRGRGEDLYWVRILSWSRKKKDHLAIWESHESLLHIEHLLMNDLACVDKMNIYN
jgi:hypothetical protein